MSSGIVQKPRPNPGIIYRNGTTEVVEQDEMLAGKQVSAHSTVNTFFSV